MAYIVQFICIISIPITLGSIGLAISNYYLIQQAVTKWQEISTQQQTFFEQQRLHNYVYLDKIVSEIQYQGVCIINQSLFNPDFANFDECMKLAKQKAVFTNVIQNLIALFGYDEFRSGLQKDCSQSTNLECSVIAQGMDLCPPVINETQKLYNGTLVNLWFHRETLYSSDLEADEQVFFSHNKYFQFFTRTMYNYRYDQLFKATWVYNTYNTSLIIAAPGQSYDYTKLNFEICEPGNYLVTYDPRCRIWYQDALSQEGTIYQCLQSRCFNLRQVFVEPYQFSFDGNIGMTISNKIMDDNGNLLSVMSIDYEISNFINKIFLPQDTNITNSDLEGYSVLFHEKNMTIFFHKDWNRFEKYTINWPDIEYPKINDYPGMKSDKLSFAQQIEKSISFAYSFNYDIPNMINIEDFFIPFQKNGVKYYSLIYPIEVRSIVNVDSQLIKKSIVMFVGRVHRDLRDIFMDSDYMSQSGMMFFCFQTLLILIIIFCALMHYAAVLYYQIDIPLRLLKAYLMQELQRSQNEGGEHQELQSRDSFPKKKTQFALSPRKGDEQQDEKEMMGEERTSLTKLKRRHKSSLNEQLQFNLTQHNISYNQSMNQSYIKHQQAPPSSHDPHVQSQQQLIFKSEQGFVQQYNNQNRNDETIQQFLSSPLNNYTNNLYSLMQQCTNLNQSPIQTHKEKVSFPQNPDQSINDSRFTFFKNYNNQKQPPNLPQSSTQNQLQSTNNLSMTQNYLINTELKTVAAVQQTQNYQSKSKDFHQCEQALTTQNNKIQNTTTGIRNKTLSVNQAFYQDYLLSINRNKNQCSNTKYFQPIEINFQQNLNGQQNKTENYQTIMVKLNQSPRRKITAGTNRLFSNRKVSEKKEQRSYMQMISKQIRSIAIFSEKDMNEVLNIKLADIPIMSQEISVIVSVFKELASVIEYLEKVHEESNSEWEKISRLRSALQMFRYVKNIEGQSIALRDMGNIFFNREDYLQSIEYYEQSLYVYLQQNSISSIKSLFDQTTNPSKFTSQNQYINQFLTMQNININYLRKIIPSLYTSGFTLTELGIQLNPSIELQNINIESLNYLMQAIKYLKCCYHLCNLIKSPDLKKLEIKILLKLTIVEAFMHMNDTASAIVHYKDAQVLSLEIQQQIQSDIEKGTKKIFSCYAINNFFLYAEGVFLIKQGKYHLGCSKLTSYLEQSTLYHFRKRALRYIKYAFEQSNTVCNKINLMERRINNSESYDVFILFQSNQIEQSQIINSVVTNSQNKMSMYQGQGWTSPKRGGNKAINQEHQLASKLQMDILNYLKNHFLIQDNDNLCMAGYDKEFQMLQGVFSVKNTSYWQRSENAVKQFLNQNNEAHCSHQQNNVYQTLSNTAANQHFNNYSPKYFEGNNFSAAKAREIFPSNNTLQSRKESNQVEGLDEDTAGQLKKDQAVSNYWETSFFQMMKEMINYYRNQKIYQASNKKNSKKILLLTFCFGDKPIPIANKDQFEKKVQFITKLFPSKPKIINLFLPIISTSQTTQQRSPEIKAVEITESPPSVEELKTSLVNQTQNSQKSQISIDLDSQQHQNTHNQPISFPENKINQQKLHKISIENMDINLTNDNNNSVYQNKYDPPQFSTNQLDKHKSQSRSKQNNHQEENLLTQQIDSLQKVENGNDSSTQPNFNDKQEQPEIQIMTERKIIPLDFKLKKFYIFSNESQIYYYLSKLRVKKTDFHKVFGSFFK